MHNFVTNNKESLVSLIVSLYFCFYKSDPNFLCPLSYNYYYGLSVHFSFLYINWVTCHWWVPFNYHLFIGTVVLLHPLCHFPCISPLLSSLSTLSPGFFPPPFWSSSHCPCPPPSLPVFAAQAFSGASSCIFADLGLTASASYLGPSLSCWAWCPWSWGCFSY